MSEVAMIQGVKQICKELGWKVKTEVKGKYKLLICPLPSDQNFAGVLFAIPKNIPRFVMYVSYRTKITPQNMNAMLDVMSIINHGLLGGCLEMDSEKGEVRYRDGIIYIKPEIDIELLRTLIATTLQDSLEYCAVLDAIAIGESSKQAISKLNDNHS